MLVQITFIWTDEVVVKQREQLCSRLESRRVTVAFFLEGIYTESLRSGLVAHMMGFWLVADLMLN